MHGFNKWTKVVLVLLITFFIAIWFFVFYKQDIGKILNEITLRSAKVEKIQGENEWQIVDFSDIAGETKFQSYLNDKMYPALEKYRMYGIEIFNDVGFILVDNEEELRNIVSKKYSDDNDMWNKEWDKIPSLVQAYLFSSRDKGKTFQKVTLGNGNPQGIYRKDNIFLVLVDHQDKHSTSVYRSLDNGISWKKLFDTQIGDMLKFKGIVDSQSFIFEWKKWGTAQQGLLITHNSGKTLEKLPNVFQEAQKKYRLSIFDKEEMLFISEDGNITAINIKTNHVRSQKVKLPTNKRIVYIEKNRETQEIYFKIRTNKDDGTRLKYNNDQTEIFYLSEEKYIPIPKLKRNFEPFVSGNYIGGFVRLKGILTHVWTFDRIHWHFEFLPDYLLGPNANSIGVGYGQIWMRIDAIYNPNLVKEKGVYLVIGTLKNL